MGLGHRHVSPLRQHTATRASAKGKSITVPMVMDFLKGNGNKAQQSNDSTRDAYGQAIKSQRGHGHRLWQTRHRVSRHPL